MDEDKKQRDNDMRSVRIRLDGEARRRLRRLAAELDRAYGEVVSIGLEAMEGKAGDESPAA